MVKGICSSFQHYVHYLFKPLSAAASGTDTYTHGTPSNPNLDLLNYRNPEFLKLPVNRVPEPVYSVSRWIISKVTII